MSYKNTIQPNFEEYDSVGIIMGRIVALIGKEVFYITRTASGPESNTSQHGNVAAPEPNTGGNGNPEPTSENGNGAAAGESGAGAAAPEPTGENGNGVVAGESSRGAGESES